MKKIGWLLAIAVALAGAQLRAQTCVPGGGVTCTPTIGLWVVPYNYANWNVPVNDNASLIDTFAGTVVLKAGSTMTGPLILSADPTAALGAATKQYVDGKVVGITSFSAPSASWPTWLVPTVTNATTTPSLTVAASAIPNSALQNSTLTLGSTALTLGVITTSVTGLTIDGVSPATMAFVDPTSSIQTQLNTKAAKGANSDITSLSGLTTPLSVSQGGTGVATGTGYAYGNGTGAFTFSTTIPYSALTGTPATGVSSVFGRTGAVVAASGDYTVAQVTGAAPLLNPTFTGTATANAFTGTALASPTAPSGTPTTGTGTLSAGTYYAKIVAVDGNGFTTAGGTESTAVTLSSTGEIQWTWTAVTGAASYQLWVGTAPGAENTFVAVSILFYTQTAALTSGTIPATNTTGSLLLAGTGKAATFNATGQYQLNGAIVIPSGTTGYTGTGTVVLSAGPTFSGTTTIPTLKLAGTNTMTHIPRAYPAWHQASGTSITTGTPFGPIFWSGEGQTIERLTANFTGTTTCSVAPVLAVFTCTTVACASPTNIASLTTGTAAGGYDSGTLSVTIPSSVFFAAEFTAGTCSSKPAIDFAATVRVN